jgi:hypothetical protein
MFVEIVTAPKRPAWATISEDGESKMPVYNGVMTVQELIDIVAFLQPQYNVVVPKYSYPMYY